MSGIVLSQSFGTHDGTFHADDVTACALLLLCGCIQKQRVFRSRDPSVLATCEYLCDVGGVYDPVAKRFDHHQARYHGQLSSAGMILQYLRMEGLLPHVEAEYLNNSLIAGIDAHDNGKAPQLTGYCLFSHVISNFTPIEYEATAQEFFDAYLRAVEFTQAHIGKALERFRYNFSCRDEVIHVMGARQNVLVFHRHIPWLEVFFEQGGEDHPAQFIIMPSQDLWKLRGVPPTSGDRMQVRTPLPAAWAGKIGADLEQACGIRGAVFCHKGRFISMWATKEAALEAAQAVIQTL